MTSFDVEISGTRVRAAAEQELHAQVADVFDTLREVPAGSLREGFTFRMGWSLYDLAREGEVLFVRSPDYSRDPATDRTGDLTVALWVHLSQVHLLHAVHAPGHVTKFNDKVVLERGAFEARTVTLRRTAPTSSGDSGWFLGIIDDDEDGAQPELEAVYAYQILGRRRSLMQALALPPGWVVGFEGDDVAAVFDPDENLVHEGALR